MTIWNVRAEIFPQSQANELQPVSISGNTTIRLTKCQRKAAQQKTQNYSVCY